MKNDERTSLGLLFLIYWATAARATEPFFSKVQVFVDLTPRQPSVIMQDTRFPPPAENFVANESRIPTKNEIALLQRQELPRAIKIFSQIPSWFQFKPIATFSAGAAIPDALRLDQDGRINRRDARALGQLVRLAQKLAPDRNTLPIIVTNAFFYNDNKRHRLPDEVDGLAIFSHTRRTIRKIGQIRIPDKPVILLSNNPALELIAVPLNAR